MTTKRLTTRAPRVGGRLSALRSLDEADAEFGRWLVYFAAGDPTLCPARLVRCAAIMAQHNGTGATTEEAFVYASQVLRLLDRGSQSGTARLPRRFQARVARCGSCPTGATPKPANLIEAEAIFLGTLPVTACNIPPVVHIQPREPGTQTEEKTMKQQTTKQTTKTTAAKEKAAREAKLKAKQQPSPEVIADSVKRAATKSITKDEQGNKRGAAAQKAVRSAKALTRGNDAPPAPLTEQQEQARLRADIEAKRDEMLGQLADINVELAENERVYDPRTTGEVAKDAKVTKIVRRNGQTLPFAIFRIDEVQDAPKKLSEVPAPKKASKKAAAKAPVTQDGDRKIYCSLSLTEGKSGDVYKRVAKHTSDKPLNIEGVFGKSQYPNRILRELHNAGHIVREQRDGVWVAFIK